MTLADWLASRHDRCSYGYAPEQHPTFCGCTTNSASEWSVFRSAVLSSVREDGTVHMSDLRRKIRGRIEPKHIGQLVRRGRREHLIREAGHERSDDIAGRNSGRMEPYYTLGRAAA